MQHSLYWVCVCVCVCVAVFSRFRHFLCVQFTVVDEDKLHCWYGRSFICVICLAHFKLPTEAIFTVKTEWMYHSNFSVWFISCNEVAAAVMLACGRRITEIHPMFLMNRILLKRVSCSLDGILEITKSFKFNQSLRWNQIFKIVFFRLWI